MKTTFTVGVLDLLTRILTTTIPLCGNIYVCIEMNGEFSGSSKHPVISAGCRHFGTITGHPPT